jgi:hypothetical protein
MAPVPEATFRSLLADLSPEAARAFVADLWRARGFDVTREGDHLFADGRELQVVAGAPEPAPTGDEPVVSTTASPAAEDDAVVGPGDLHRMLLYDVPRDRAADVFETHFGRSLDDDWATAGDEAAPARAADGAASDGEAVPPVLPRSLRRLLVGVAGPPPWEREAARGAVRDRRVLVAVAALLVLLPAAWWGLAVHEPAPASPSTVPFSATDSELPVEGRYQVVASLHTRVDGARFSVVGSRTYAPDEPAVALARWTYDGPDGQSTVVRFVGNGSYTRQSWTSTSDYQSFRERRRGDPDFVRAVDATRSVYSADPDHTGTDPDPAGGVPLAVLAQLPYERTGTTTYAGRTVVRYVPETGWITRTYGLLDDRQTTYVRAATGEVLVARGNGAVLHAEIEATVVSAETWWGALTADGEDLTVRYTVRTDVDRPRPPPWVSSTGRNGTGGNLSAPLVRRCNGCSEQYAAVRDRRSGEQIPHAGVVERWWAPRSGRRI